MLGRCSTSGQDERGLVSGAGRPLRAAGSGAGAGDEFVTHQHRPGRPSRNLCFCSCRSYPNRISSLSINTSLNRTANEKYWCKCTEVGFYSINVAQEHMTDQNTDTWQRESSHVFSGSCVCFMKSSIGCVHGPQAGGAAFGTELGMCLALRRQRQGPCFGSFWSRCLCSKHAIEHMKLKSLSLLKKQGYVWNIKIFQSCLC